MVSGDSGSNSKLSTTDNLSISTEIRNISIRVQNTNGEPIGNASVNIDNVTKTTGSAGGCTYKDISDGAHQITASAEGYNEYHDFITVSEEATSFTLIMQTK